MFHCKGEREKFKKEKEKKVMCLEFVKINLKIEDFVKEVYEKIQNIQKNSIIAGGYLTDRYIGRKYKDVDIFIKDDRKKNEEIKKLFEPYQINERKLSSYGYPFATEIIDYEIHGISFQFVFTKMGIKAVKYFDFRFREFFYFKDSTYASKEALLDIKRKKIVFGVTKAPLVAFYRLFLFQERYGFHIDEHAFEKLKAILHLKKIPYNIIMDYFDEKIQDKMLKEKMKTYIKPSNTNDYQKIGVLQTIYAHDRRMNIYNKMYPRDIVESVFEKKDTLNETFTYDFGENLLELAEKRVKRKISYLFNSFRIKLIYQEPELVGRWNKYIKALDNEIVIEQWINECLTSMQFQTAQLILYLEKLLKIVRKKHVVSHCVRMTLNNRDVFMSRYDFLINYRKYLQDCYIKINIEHLGNYLYDRSKDELKSIDGFEELEEEIKNVLKKN